MITTNELKHWREKILINKQRAERNALETNKNESISRYYIHAAEVCSNQASIIERLIIDSENKDKEGR